MTAKGLRRFLIFLSIVTFVLFITGCGLEKDMVGSKDVDPSILDEELADTTHIDHEEPADDELEEAEEKGSSDEETGTHAKGKSQEGKTTAINKNTKKQTDSQQKKRAQSSTKKQQRPAKAPPKEKQCHEDEAKKSTIVHSIVISNKEIPLPPTKMRINDGETVLDALLCITRAKKIQMDYRGGQGGTAYVEGIANVYEFDRGQGSGWMYRVNGIFPDRGAGVVPLQDGDRVEWLYTTDLGQDLGADLQPFRR